MVLPTWNSTTPGRIVAWLMVVWSPVMAIVTTGGLDGAAAPAGPPIVTSADMVRTSAPAPAHSRVFM